jgi:hypothetical protein
MYPGYHQQQPGPVENNMTMAVVALLIFWPLGIMSVINASKVNGCMQRGDYNGAHLALVESKKWSKYALIAAAVWYGLTLVCCVGWLIVGGGAALFSGSSA